MRDTVKKLSDSVFILFDKLEENETALKAVLSQVEGLRLDVHSQKTDALLYAKLRDDVQILRTDIDIKLDHINYTIANITDP